MHWQATALDGTELNSWETDTYERVNDRGGARALRVSLDNGHEYVADCAPEAGESLHLFTRRAIKNACTPEAFEVACPIVELRRGGEMVSRLYLHPEHGPVFSSRDLNL